MRAGQAILESLIVVIFLVGAFLFFFDFAYSLTARLMLENAAARAARADTVGFNAFQRTKSLRSGMIPVSGRREVPDADRAPDSFVSELAFVRAYLRSQSAAEARGILHYERWDDLSHSVDRGNNEIHVTAAFRLPLQLPEKIAGFFGVIPSGDGSDPAFRKLTSEWSIEDHASHYLIR